jgi:hypothetical protein
MIDFEQPALAFKKNCNTALYVVNKNNYFCLFNFSIQKLFHAQSH